MRSTCFGLAGQASPWRLPISISSPLTRISPLVGVSEQVDAAQEGGFPRSRTIPGSPPRRVPGRSARCPSAPRSRRSACRCRAPPAPHWGAAPSQSPSWPPHDPPMPSPAELASTPPERPWLAKGFISGNGASCCAEGDFPGACRKNAQETGAIRSARDLRRPRPPRRSKSPVPPPGGPGASSAANQPTSPSRRAAAPKAFRRLVAPSRTSFGRKVREGLRTPCAARRRSRRSAETPSQDRRASTGLRRAPWLSEGAGGDARRSGYFSSQRWRSGEQKLENIL